MNPNLETKASKLNFRRVGTGADQTCRTCRLRQDVPWYWCNVTGQPGRADCVCDEHRGAE